MSTYSLTLRGDLGRKLTTEELDAFHPDFPVATCIVAQK